MPDTALEPEYVCTLGHSSIADEFCGREDSRAPPWFCAHLQSLSLGAAMFQFQTPPHAAAHAAAHAVRHSPPVPPPGRGVVASLPAVRLGEASPPASARLLTTTPPPTSARSFNVRSVPSGLHLAQPAWQHTHSEPANSAGFEMRALRPALPSPPVLQRATGQVAVVIAPTERAVARTGVSCAGQPPGRPKDAEAAAVVERIVVQIPTTCAQDGSPGSKVSGAPQSPSSSPQASTRAVVPGSPTSPQLGRAILAPPSPRVTECELELRLSQVAAALLPPVAQVGLGDRTGGAGATEELAPAPEEVPPWKPCQSTSSIAIDVTTNGQEIGWTPSFTTLAHLRPEDADLAAPTSPEAGFKARELADRPTDSCSLATTSDGCSPVAVPEVQAAGCQYRRDLLLSFRRSGSPGGGPRSGVHDERNRSCRRRLQEIRRRRGLLNWSRRCFQIFHSQHLRTRTRKSPDFLAASVRSRGRKPQAAVQVVCSFHTRAWPGARRRREEGDLLESSLRYLESRIWKMCGGLKVPTEDSQDSPQEKPSRLSMAPTVHDAHCKESDESEVISSPLSGEEPWSAAVDSAPRQEIDEPSPPAEGAEAAEAEVTRLQAELEELRGTLTRERALRDEAETAQSRTAKRLSSAEGRAAQLATQLQRCKVERDELRRQLHEKSEIHVELTRKLRKVQEANRSLDSELNKTEALRLAAQNRAAAAQEARGQAEALLDSLRDLLRNVDEVDNAEAAASLTKLKEQLEGFAAEPQFSAPKTKDPEAEEELPTAGGLLREWACVYDNAEDARRDPPAGPVLLQQRSPSWNKATKTREVPSSSPPSARGAGEQLAQLSLRDLSEIKALKKPPPPIRMLMEVCCLLFHIQPVKHLDEQCVHHRLRTDYWEPARRYLLSDPFLLSKLRSHGKDIGASQRAKIKKYFKDPEFSAERMLKCSRAAFELYCCVSRLMELDEPTIPSFSCQSDVRSVACTTTTASSNETIASAK
eukprot:s539_g4.t3